MKLRFFIGLIFFLGLVAAVPATSDFQFSVVNSGISGWQLTAVSNPQLFGGPLTTLNPTINLILGKRYAISDPVHAFHPFQILAKGSNSFVDVVLLATDSAAGSMQTDPGVGWTDDGNGNIAFTLTPALLAAMQAGGNTPGYRCGVHVDVMRGDFAVSNGGVPIINPIIKRIPKSTIRISLAVVASGLTSPLGAAFPNDGTGRMFVYDQAGKVWVLSGTPRQKLRAPFLDVSGRLTPLGVSGPGTYDERGLLGFALHPQFAKNGKVYTHTSEPLNGAADFTVALPAGRKHDHQEVIAEWKVIKGNPNRIDPASRRELLRIDKPQFNHNGGTIWFGPDGDLYIGIGDGGGADDSDGEPFIGGLTVGHGPGGNGQNINVALGKILRIDVNTTNSANHHYGIPADNPFVGKAGLDEIFFYGIRNPYSFSFDTSGGALYLADVGQNSIEEIDRLTAAQKGGNLGWRFKEGTFYFDSRSSQTGTVVTAPVGTPPAGLIDPIAEYDHDDGAAIVGGAVYHGTQFSYLRGKYICGDFGGVAGPNGRLFFLDTGNVLKEFQIGNPDRKLGLFLKGFAQDLNGEIYVCGSTAIGPFGTTGVVLQITKYTGAPGAPMDPL